MLYPARRRPRHRAPVGIGSGASCGLHLEAGQHFRAFALHGGCQRRAGLQGLPARAPTRLSLPHSQAARLQRPVRIRIACPGGPGHRGGVATTRADRRFDDSA